jgi:hypothetical protein
MACACKKNKTVVEEKKTIEEILVNSTTGEISLPKDYFLPFKKDIWLGTYPEDKKTNIDKLVEESMVLVDDVNHPARKTYTVFVGEPEPQKSFKEKIKSFFKL